MVPSPQKAVAAGASGAAGAAPVGGRGAFILFEGIDRCGKSTQAERLVANLRKEGVDAELWRFPDRETGIGRMINDYLASKADLEDHAIHLLFAANRWEKKNEMEAKLAAGTTLVVDRYSYSGVAFSSAKGMDRAWCEAQEVGLPAPDAVLYLRLEVEDARTRGGFGEERYEKEEMQREVLRYFDAWSADAGGLWRTVPALQTREALEPQLLDLALAVVRRCAAADAPPMGRLWGAQTGSAPGDAAGAGRALAGIDANVPPAAAQAPGAAAKDAAAAGGGGAAAAAIEGENLKG